MQLNKFLDVKPEVAEAIAAGKPVVALESTIISHGMPYPDNLAFAAEVERIVRAEGAVPATMAIIDGVLKVGLTQDELELMCKGEGVAKVSRRELPIMVAEKRTGATTVASTMILASLAGIRVFATGGIGGVHRGAETTMDISADLEELAHTPVMVVCAGAKSILDLGLTLEEESLPTVLINDGRVLRNNLRLCGRDEVWLQKILKQEHCTTKEVFLLTVDENGKTLCVPKEADP